MARHLAGKVGTVGAVLVERGRRGRLEDFTPCAIDFGEPGTIVSARITGHDRRVLAAASVIEETALPAASPPLAIAFGG